MLLAAVGIAVIAVVGFWIVGGVLLRAGGLIIALLGVLDLAIYGNPTGIIPLLIGILLWLIGHWHYALRHHEYKGPLAGRIFYQLLPRRLDPTRNWTTPVTITNPPQRQAPSRPPGSKPGSN